MSDRRPPAGWYDDPAGGGGRRYWNGTAWTQRVEPPRTGSRPETAARPADARLPDGYMMLNGVKVPLGSKGTTSSVASTTTTNSHPWRTFAGLFLLLVAAVVLAVWLFTTIDGDADAGEASGGEVTVEVTSDDETPVIATWDDGSGKAQSDFVESGWTTTFTRAGGTPYVRVEATSDDTSVTCRITGANSSADDTGVDGQPADCRLGD